MKGSLVIRRAVCPGSFDPVTNGHLDVISRAASLFDEVTVAVLEHRAKRTLFSPEERQEMLVEVTSDFPNVTVDSWHGLLVDYCHTHDIPAIVKGLRAVSDFESELQMAQMNRSLSGVETLFIPTSSNHSFIASRLLREVARYGGDVSAFVPQPVAARLTGRFLGGDQ